MSLLINLVSPDDLSWERLSQLVTTLNGQRFDGLTLNLQLAAGQTLTSAQQAQLAHQNVTVDTQPTLDRGPHGYLINLQTSDTVLPGALAQWRTVTAQHPATMISLATFESSQPLADQIKTYLATYSDSPLLATYHTLSDDDALWPQLWGMQSYTLQTNLTNAKLLSQRLRPTGILLPTAALDSQLPLASLAQNLQMLSRTREVIRLHVPTIQRTTWRVEQPLAWLDQLQQGTRVPLDAIWEPLFTTYYQRQLNDLLHTANRRSLSTAQHEALLKQVRRLPVNTTKRWSRLNLLHHLSPNLAHQLFF